MRLQLFLNLALCLMQTNKGVLVHASAPELSSLITTLCDDSEELGSVEVTIKRQNFSRLSLTSVEELRLLDNNCSSVSCCGSSGWKWRFSEDSLCGGQLTVQIQDNFEMVTLGNVLRVNKDGLETSDARSWMALISCSFLRNRSRSTSGSGKIDPPLPPIDMYWELHRTNFYQYFPETSQRITLNPSTYVGNWKEGSWLQLDIYPSDDYIFDDTDYKGVHFTVSSYSLNFIHEENGTNTTEVRQLIKNGCPPNSDFYIFGDGIAHHDLRVAVVINLLHVAELNAHSIVRYVYISFNVSLCRDHGSNSYKHELPECQAYSAMNCKKPMQEPNPAYTVEYKSGLLTIRNPNQSPEPPTQVYPQPSIVPGYDSAASSTPTSDWSRQTVEKEKESSDNAVNLSSYLVTAICVSCFICGCTLIGGIWMMCTHRRRIANLQGTSLNLPSSKATEQLQGIRNLRYDKSSLDSGIPDSPLSSPVRGYYSTCDI